MIGIYLHVPYCTVRCSYCDFYLVPKRGRDLEAYAAALIAEIEAVPAGLRGRDADTVHFGGGTPSLLAPDTIGRVLEAVRRSFSLAPGVEIGLEANPEDVTRERVSALLGSGITRLTIGVQSLDEERLRILRRPHDVRGALAALGAARAAGVSSLGADLILGLPGEEASRTLEGVARVADAGVDHLSLYLLELHPRTRLGRAAALGRVTPPSDEAAAAVYEGGTAILEERGFEQYEISNFARPGHRSRHNLKYWTDAEYVGFGPAAHSYTGGRRYANAPDLAGYLEGGGRPRRIEDPGSPARRACEALLLGLRLVEGIDPGRLRERYGAAAPRPDEAAVGELERAGLLERTPDRLRLTPRGRLLSNEVFERLLPGGIVPS